MSANVGSAFFSLRAGTDQLGSDIARGMRLAKQRLKAAAVAIGRTVAVSLSVGAAAITASVAKGISSIDQLAKESDKLGIATQRLQLLRHAAELTGVEATKLGTGLQRMTRRVAEAAQGTGEAVAALKELNLDAAALNRLSPDEVFLRIGEAMRNVTNQSDRIRLAMKLFDSEGVGLVNTLKITRDQLTAMKSDMDGLGVTLDRQMAARVEKAKDQFSRLGLALTGVINQLTIQLAPIAGIVAEKFVEWSRETGAITRASRSLANWLKDVIAGLGSLSYWSSVASEKFNALAAGIALARGDLDGAARALARMEAARIKAFNSLNVDQFVGSMKKAQEAIAGVVASQQDFSLNASGLSNVSVLSMVEEMLSKFKSAGDPWAEMRRQIIQVEEALAAGIVDQAELVREKLNLVKEGLANIGNQAAVATESWQSFAFNAAGAIDEFVETGRLSIKSFVRDVIQDMAKIQLRNLLFGQGTILGGLFGKVTGGLGIPTTTIPGKANGGRVGAAQFVGERGVELFQPDVPGTIIPNAETQGLLSKMKDGAVSVTMNFASGVSRQELAAEAQNIEERVVKGILSAKRNGGQFGESFA